jgi:hypothetical protein
MSDIEIEYSDDEQTMSWGTAQRFKLVFGKYEGKRMAFMILKSEHESICVIFFPGTN